MSQKFATRKDEDLKGEYSLGNILVEELLGFE